MLLSITNLTTGDFIVQDPSGLSDFEMKVGPSATKSGVVISQDALTRVEPLLIAAQTAGKLTYVVSDDPNSAADNQYYNVRKALTTPVTAALHDEVIVCKLTSPGAVGVALPSSLPVGTILDIIDGTGDASSNNITITPQSPDTINGAATLVLNANFGSARVVKSEAGKWLRGAVPGAGPTGSAGGDLTGSTYPNPTVAAHAIGESKLALTVAGVAQPLAGPGAADVTHRTTLLTPAGSLDAITLADGTVVGQRKSIVNVAATNTARVTPATGNGFSHIDVTAQWSAMELEWQAGGWTIIALSGTTTVV